MDNRPAASRIISAHVLGSRYSGLVLFSASGSGYAWRLERRIGGELVAESTGALRTKAEAMHGLRCAAICAAADEVAEELEE